MTWIISLLLNSWDEILKFISDLHTQGVSWGAVITAILLWRKLTRNKRFQERDERMEAKLNAIMQKVGAECANSIVTEYSAKSVRMRSILHLPAKLVVRIAGKFTTYLIMRRKKKMNKLKSRKLWAAIITALLVALNDQLGWGFNQESIVSFVTLAVGYILSQAHVDAKQNGGIVNEPTPFKSDTEHTV